MDDFNEVMRSLGRIEQKIDSMGDHRRRIRALEATRNWALGWLSALSVILGTLWQRYR